MDTYNVLGIVLVAGDGIPQRQTRVPVLVELTSYGEEKNEQINKYMYGVSDNNRNSKKCGMVSGTRSTGDVGLCRLVLVGCSEKTSL